MNLHSSADILLRFFTSKTSRLSPLANEFMLGAHHPTAMRNLTIVHTKAMIKSSYKDNNMKNVKEVLKMCLHTEQYVYIVHTVQFTRFCSRYYVMQETDISVGLAHFLRFGLFSTLFLIAAL